VKAATSLACIVAMSVFSNCADPRARAAVDAIAVGDVSRAREIYASGVDPDTRFDGLTALMLAACKAPPSAIEMLLEVGADPNLSSPRGWTPLGYAVGCGNVPVVRALLEGGADLGVVSPEGETALSLARSAGEIEVEALLIEAGAASDSADSATRRSVTGY